MMNQYSSRLALKLVEEQYGNICKVQRSPIGTSMLVSSMRPEIAPQCLAAPQCRALDGACLCPCRP